MISRRSGVDRMCHVPSIKMQDGFKILCVLVQEWESGKQFQ